MWNERGTVASVPWGSCAWMGIFSVWGQSFCCHSQNQRERAEVGTDPPSEGGRGGKQTPLDLKYIERRGRSDISYRSLKLFLTSLPEVKAQAGARWPWFPGSADRPGAVPGGDLGRAHQLSAPVPTWRSSCMGSEQTCTRHRGVTARVVSLLWTKAGQICHEK